MAALLRVAVRDDIPQVQRVRRAVRENRLTSGVITDVEVRFEMERPGSART